MPKDVSWDGKSGAFVWWGGEVRLGAGFYYQVGEGVDSYVGHFSSFHGDVTIQHDIGTGGYAGEWPQYRDESLDKEWCVEGARVWISSSDWTTATGAKEKIYSARFPDSGYAHFYLVSSRVRDREIIERIAKTYRPLPHFRIGLKHRCLG